MRYVWIIFWLGFNAGPAPAQPTLTPEKIDLVERLLAEKMSKDGIPGLSVAIVLDGELVWANGYGFADLENYVPAKATTAYRSASIGKSITAVAAMQLAESGRLDLDAPIQKYCPDYPEKEWTITLRHLLNHTSGIRHYGGPRHEAELLSARHYESISEALHIFKDDALLHRPGERHTYSTYGYNLLGCAVEGGAGEPFMTFLQKSVFIPAGMTATQADDPWDLIPNRAAGYRYDENGVLRRSYYVDMSNKLPAGGYITTAEDLARFAAAFMNDELAAASTKEQMLTPQLTNAGDTIPYGLGWGLFPNETWYGEREAFHGGQTPKVSGVLYLLPDRRFAVVILTNLEGVNGRVDLAAKIAVEVLELDNK